MPKKLQRAKEKAKAKAMKFEAKAMQFAAKKLYGADVGDRLTGSLAAGLDSVRRGAHMLRVHDVAVACRCCPSVAE